ncbi:MAG: serine/threonine protein kinase [Phycisphaerales bacterium]|nr:serine/threonine protein kinase [Phycisphaerales bacterium]
MNQPSKKQDLTDTSPLAMSSGGGSAGGGAGAGGGGGGGGAPGSANRGPQPDPVRDARADDTKPVPMPQKKRDGPPPSVADVEAAIQETAKSGTNVDTLVGRFVIDQGFITREELDSVIERAKTGSAVNADRNLMSLAAILVNEEYITKRQLARIQQQMEAERSGQKIPGYKIMGKLGAGAMATVVKARQVSLDRLVAIKLLPPKYTNPQFIERFYAEGRAAAQLNHPNIVQAYDVGKVGDQHYFVMEYVDGRTVYDDITSHKRLSEKDAIDITIQIASALLHAHEKGLIHRDVKPKNIMITKEGVAKLADMGLARAMNDREAAEAEAGKAFGTPYYISPEQVHGKVTIGPPADIYSLGATLYHMVTGVVPFDGKNPSAVMHKHLKEELKPPDQVNPRLSAGLAEVIEMMMAKGSKDRYQSCKDLILDLKAVREGKPPIIAHKDVAGADLASLAHIEASTVPVEVAVAPAKSGDLASTLTQWPVMLILILLFISFTLNIVLWFKGG